MLKSAQMKKLQIFLVFSFEKSARDFDCEVKPASWGSERIPHWIWYRLTLFRMWKTSVTLFIQHFMAFFARNTDQVITKLVHYDSLGETDVSKLLVHE